MRASSPASSTRLREETPSRSQRRDDSPPGTAQKPGTAHSTGSRMEAQLSQQHSAGSMSPSRQTEQLGSVIHVDMNKTQMPPRRLPPLGMLGRKAIPPVNTSPLEYYAWLRMPDKDRDTKSLRYMPDSVNGSPRHWMRHWEYPAVKKKPRPPSPRALRRALRPFQLQQETIRPPRVAASPNSTWLLETSMSVDSSGHRSPRHEPVEVGWGRFCPAQGVDKNDPWVEVLPFGCVGEVEQQSSVCSFDRPAVVNGSVFSDGSRSASDSRLMPAVIPSRGQSVGQALVLGGETSRAVLHKAMHGRKSPSQWRYMQRHAGTGRIAKDRDIYGPP